MTAMLSVVAIFASMATIDMTLVEYRDDLLGLLYYLNEDAEATPASIINAEVTRGLDRDIEEEDNTVTLVTIWLADQPPQGNHPLCGSSLGIDIDNGRSVFCKLERIEIQATEITEDMPHDMAIKLTFSGESDNSFLLLGIPVFRKPQKYETAGQWEEFKEWVARERVGINFPMNEQQLKDLRQYWVPVNFQWLNDLLSMGVLEIIPPQDDETQDENEDETEEYISRPLVLSQDITEKLLELAYWRKYVDDDMHLPSTSIRPR